MSESLFNIFGDHVTQQATRSASRQPLENVENMGKTISSGPVKPKEPMKKFDQPKKSFLSNAAKVLLNTPLRQPCTPRSINTIEPIIYNDDKDSDCDFSFDEIEFTKSSYNLDNYHSDMFDFLPMPYPKIVEQPSPPSTPPPAIRRHSMEFNNSYEDEYFTDQFCNEACPDDEGFASFNREEDQLPDLY